MRLKNLGYKTTFITTKRAQKLVDQRYDILRKSPCWTCGATSEYSFSVVEGRAYCSECLGKMYESRRDLLERTRLCKAETMRNTCYKIMDTQLIDLYEMKEAVESVYEAILEGKRFDSALEMAVASVLIDSMIRCKPQFRIGKYSVDFYLPTLNVAVEIDGIYHKEQKDIERDIALRREMDADFEVLHIKEFYVKSNLMHLPSCIVHAAKLQREMRKKDLHMESELHRRFLNHVDLWNRKDLPDPLEIL